MGQKKEGNSGEAARVITTVASLQTMLKKNNKKIESAYRNEKEGIFNTVRTVGGRMGFCPDSIYHTAMDRERGKKKAYLYNFAIYLVSRTTKKNPVTHSTARVECE